jgi:16S rRNA (uracil1498-N3)-methyltransferase
MRYFIFEKSVSTGETVVIKGPDVHHMRKVLRLSKGDIIGLLNGRGNSATAQIILAEPDRVTVQILTCSHHSGPFRRKLIIAQSFLKDRKMDHLVRQMTELGATIWIPFCSDRSVSRPDSHRLRKRLERWSKISRESLKQCRRGRVMAIEPAESFQDVLLKAQASELRILFWENETHTMDHTKMISQCTQIKQIFAVLGPEGGFSSTEVDLARAHGFVTASLGPRILRAQTAAVAAVAILQFLYGDMGKKPLTNIGTFNRRENS